MRNSIISFSKIAFAFLALAGMTTLTSCDDDDEKFVNPKGEKEYNVYFNLGKYNSDENYLEHEYAYHAYGVGHFYIDTFNNPGDTLLASGEDVEFALEGAKQSDLYEAENGVWRDKYSLVGGNKSFVMCAFTWRYQETEEGNKIRLDDHFYDYDTENGKELPFAKIVIKDKIMKQFDAVTICRISSETLETTNLITKKPLTITKELALIGKQVAGTFVVYDIRDKESSAHLFNADGSFNTYGYDYDQILNAEDKICELAAGQFEVTNVVTEAVAGYKVAVTAPFTIAE